MNVGAVHGGVATGRPARTTIDELGVIDLADKKLAGLVGRTMHLDVALEAKIIVALREQLAVYRPVRVMAGGATFAHRFMFVNEGA